MATAIDVDLDLNLSLLIFQTAVIVLEFLEVDGYLELIFIDDSRKPLLTSKSPLSRTTAHCSRRCRKDFPAWEALAADCPYSDQAPLSRRIALRRLGCKRVGPIRKSSATQYFIPACFSRATLST